MPQPCSKPLKANPFIAYRDPVTGRWMVIRVNSPTPKSVVLNTNSSSELQETKDSQSKSEILRSNLERRELVSLSLCPG